MTPRVTFGILALNAQPFLEANLRAIYPFAHQIIVVEGAVRSARRLATAEGHSTDGTLEMLHRFQAEQDPQHKLEIVLAQEVGYADGLWPEKDEMSQAYAERAMGDWLWQVDADEFYLPEDMAAVLAMLDQEPQITAVSFPYLEFFGSFGALITGKWHLHDHPRFHRLFSWGPGYQYASHRPPTVLDAHGRDLRSLQWIADPRRDGQPIFLRHYSYVLPKQARQKVDYYAGVNWTDEFRENQRWYDESYIALRNPFFLGERGFPIFQWLERFKGEHPPEIQVLRQQLESGELAYEQRNGADIKRLLKTGWYRLASGLLRIVLPLYWKLRSAFRR